MNKEPRILILEDVATDAELIQRELRRAQFAFTARRVDTRAAFLQHLIEFAPDLILSDYSLPQFTALDALSLLKEQGRQIPFILITGSLTEEVAVECMKQGANDYILKSSLKRLPTAVVNVLEKHASERAKATAVEALRAQQAFLREVIDTAPNPIFVKDRNGKYTLVNKALADLYGTTIEHLVGKTDEDFAGSAEELERFLQQDREVIETLRRKFIPEEPVTDIRSGEVRWFQMTKVPLLSSEDDGPRVLGVATDLTERKRAEEALRASEEQLRQSQKLEAIGQLAGGVAHDFNNLLTAITGYSDLTLRRLAPDDPLRNYIEEIKKAGERAASLTRQLLAFSRKQVLQPKVLEMNTAIAEMDKMLRRLIVEDIELVTALDPALGQVKADPGQIQQVVMNLVVNARDAMPKGGKLVIETANVYLDEKYTYRHIAVQAGRYVMLAVSDTGCGIDAETQKHIFEPFFTTKEPDHGTGLGLSTVYGIVKQSGGNIWVYSEVGRGTTFKVYLPRVDEESEKVEPSAAPGEAPEGWETILLVEDEEAVRELAANVLRLQGYNVLEACNGEEALRVAQELPTGEQLHLLLTDMVMPRMNGRELADQLLPLRPGLRVLFMSGYTDRAIVHHGILHQATAFLEKPFTLEALARKVRAVLDAPEKASHNSLAGKPQ